MKNEELSDLELPRIELTEDMIVDVPPTPEDEQRLKTINELAKQME